MRREPRRVPPVKKWIDIAHINPNIDGKIDIPLLNKGRFTSDSPAKVLDPITGEWTSRELLTIRPERVDILRRLAKDHNLKSVELSKKYGYSSKNIRDALYGRGRYTRQKLYKERPL